ncbi:hypothetical protein [Corynebacterium suedekumii]|uniref:ATP/GTP-binding protein n=1 Tax=Corynebacterium suedekumii TaxID=3049801 RepID=A0ABY8VLI6_9CORY|nr:hypothetical protein [Corynebacterium suedekumii]WIM69533.1 hypothetical protein QP029_09785 [Corynebacterium suedekumii]
MPRRNRPGRKGGRREAKAAPRPLPRDGAAYYGTQVVDGPRWAHGEPYLFRHMGAAAATKFYVCPGCNQNIPPGVAHIVAWPKDSGRGADDRRHWHRPCWDRR